ncbi:MAG TPA: AI-2E family transporter [Bryobacteraceae bacterium]|nr:AI-2E family transporter [Bryobacteraceae bacterium]
MLGFDFRAARWTWTAVLVLLGIELVYLLRSTLFLFILAVLFAYLLAPLVNLIDRLLPGKRTRTAALALAYVLLVGLVVLAASSIGSKVVQQANLLAKTFPGTLGGFEAVLQDKVPDALKTGMNQRIDTFLASIPGYSLKFLGLLGNLIYVVIIPILSFLCIKDGPLVKQHIVSLLEDGPRRQLLDHVLADMDLVLAHYMRALVMLSINTFTCYSIFLTVIGVAYAVLLGAMAGALEFIPVVGPLAGGIVVLVVGGAASGHWIAILIFLVIFRLLQDYGISPHLMGQGVELHPLLVLFGVFAGAELAGVAGTFLSVPLLALARVLYRRIYEARKKAQEAKLVA